MSGGDGRAPGRPGLARRPWCQAGPVHRLRRLLAGLLGSSCPAGEELGKGFTLAELAEQEPLATVVRSCPALWLDCVDTPEGLGPTEMAMPLEELLPLASLGPTRRGRDGEEWELFLLDEWGASVNLRLEEDEEDPVLTCLRAHPEVVDADHVDTEVYLWVTRTPMSAPDAAALTLTALHAGHLDALHRAGLRPPDGTTGG